MSGTTGQGSPSLSDSTILQLQNEIERLKAEVERLNALVEAEQRGSFSSVVRQVRNELDTAIGERDAIRAENDRLLALVDSKMQDLARANEVGVELTKELTQSREALREAMSQCAAMHHRRGMNPLDNPDYYRWKKALGGGG